MVIDNPVHLRQCCPYLYWGTVREAQARSLQLIPKAAGGLSAAL